MAIYIGKKEVGIVLEPTLKQQNINIYKTQDYINLVQNGGELPTDEEYELAEAELQVLYKSIMEGDNE